MPDVECTNCHRIISINARACPHCGQPNRPLGFSRATVVVILAIALAMVVGVGAVSFFDNAGPSTQQSAKAQSDLPQTQRDFTSLVSSFVEPYHAANTEVLKTNVRFDRKAALQKYFQDSLVGPRFQDWIGGVSELTTNTEGDAHISVHLAGSNIVLENWNNRVSDLFAATMIPRESPLYRSLMHIKPGDQVRISGFFLPTSTSADFIEEASLTEQDSIAEPEFIVRFTQISLASDPLPVTQPESEKPTAVSSPADATGISPQTAEPETTTAVTGTSGVEESPTDTAPTVPASPRPEIIRNGSVVQPAETVYRPGNGVSPPEETYSVEPEFTDQARKARLGGSVLVGLIVGADGSPRNVHIERPLGMGLDEKAMDAVRQFRFKPGMKDGQPVACEISIEIAFKTY
jgi:TonB family protein